MTVSEETVDSRPVTEQSFSATVCGPDTPGAVAVMFETSHEVPGDPVKPTHPGLARTSRLARWWHRRADTRAHAHALVAWHNDTDAWVAAGRPTRTVITRRYMPSVVLTPVSPTTP